MARMYMKVDFKEVLDKLQRMEKAVAEKGTKEILEEAGQFMKSEFVGLAPRDTGALQASIDYKIKGTIVEVGVQTAKAKGRVPLYSWYQE